MMTPSERLLLRCFTFGTAAASAVIVLDAVARSVMLG